MCTEVSAALEHEAAHGLRAVAVLTAAEGPLPREPEISWVNDALIELVGMGGADLTGRPVDGLLQDTDLDDLLRETRGGVQTARLRTAAGAHLPVVVSAVPVPPAAWGARPRWTLSIAPETDSQRAVIAARAYEQRFSALAERSPVPTVLSDVGLRLAFVNDAFTRLLAVPAEALLGTGWLDHVFADDLEAVVSCVQRALEGHNAETEARLVDASAALHWTHLRLAPAETPGHGAAFVGTVEDVTERRAFQERLSYQARHDHLTGLPNRTELWEHLTEVLGAGRPRRGSKAASDRASLAVLFLDLDNFKLVNDSLGHDAGDTLLVEVARRLSSAVRDGDLVVRFGGDEFVVVCHGVTDDDRMHAAADRLLATLTAPVTLGSQQVHPSGSIGITRARPEHRTAEDVLRDADIAMYQAKSHGKNRWAVFDVESRAQARDALELVSDLRVALTAGKLDVVYQPIVATAPGADGALAAVEALVRWNHPERGPLSPTLFVPLAEQHGLVHLLGAYVLDISLAQMARWRSELGDRAPARVNVNLSAEQLADASLPTAVAAALQRHGVPPATLCLELTESALMQDPTHGLEALSRLRDLGVWLAIDDFGTGYSSLAYLTSLPVHYLKIDRSFVTELNGDATPARQARGGLVAEAVVSLARALGMSTVAEGVEEASQLELLQRMGCPFAQGWLFARPMPGPDLVGWLANAAPLGSGSTSSADSGMAEVAS
ncbi:MAG: putative bifunctional diguanylate cyclase/phosphodiesterase [Actinomycetes bacterium]